MGSLTQLYHFFVFSGSRKLSGGLIAAIAIGSVVGAILVCCWVGSVIECFQHMYKYWCSCCHDNTDVTEVTFTTVIPNPTADPSTVVVAGMLPPSYSSIFRNDAAFHHDVVTPLSTYSERNFNSYGTSSYDTSPYRPSNYESLPFRTSPFGNSLGNSSYGNSSHGHSPFGNSSYGTSSFCNSSSPSSSAYAPHPRATQSIAVQVPEYIPPNYDPSKNNVRWC